MLPCCRGDLDAVRHLARSGLDVFAHNLETVGAALVWGLAVHASKGAGNKKTSKDGPTAGLSLSGRPSTVKAHPPALPASRPIALNPRTIPPLTGPHPARPPKLPARWSGCSGVCATLGPATSRAWTCCGRPRSAACTPSPPSCWGWVSHVVCLFLDRWAVQRTVVKRVKHQVIPHAGPG